MASGIFPFLCRTGLNLGIVDPALFEAVLKEISKSITGDEPAITHFDTIAGDGDCGETLLAGSNGLFPHLLLLEPSVQLILG